MFYICLLSPSGLTCHLWPVIPYWFLDWMICPMMNVWVLNFPTIIVLLSISPFINICFTYFGTSIFTIIISFYWIDPHIIFFLFMATSVTYGISQARGQIGAAAPSLIHSHSNTGSEPHLWHKLQLVAMPNL